MPEFAKKGGAKELKREVILNRPNWEKVIQVLDSNSPIPIKAIEMFSLLKFISGYLFCLLVFSLSTSLLLNINNLYRIGVRGVVGDLFHILIMFSPSTFGYYCIHYFLQYKKKKWNKRVVYILVYMSLALLYTYVFGFVIPIIGLVGGRYYSVEQFLGLAIASGLTYLVLRGSFDQE